MPRRRIYDLLGHVHFVTFSCNGRRKLLNQDRCKRIVLAHLEQLRCRFHANCIGFVVMPEHVHSLLRFESEGHISLFKQEWKRQSSSALLHHFRRTKNPILSYLRQPNGGYRIWTPKSYDFNVYTLDKGMEKLNYMHNNPVKRGLVNQPEQWPFSSARWYAERKSVGVTMTHIHQ